MTRDTLDVSPIRPIETPYAGRLFRSRLEARWAVFYTALGIPWMYEPQGFALADDLCYLPDFYLPHLNAYVEIKAAEPSETEERKASHLAVATRTRVFICFGQPGYQCFGGYPYGQLASDGAYLYDGTQDYDGQAAWDCDYTWCVCPHGMYGIEYAGRSERIACGRDHGSDKIYTYDDPRLLAAYDRANRARFPRGSC